MKGGRKYETRLEERRGERKDNNESRGKKLKKRGYITPTLMWCQTVTSCPFIAVVYC